jgi:predicted nucleic acid-binding protein
MIFSFIESGALSALWSFMLDYENSLDPVVDRRAFVQDVSLHCSGIVEPDESIRKLAVELATIHQAKARDALHLACAEHSGCDYLLTCDDRLGKQGRRLRDHGVLTLEILNPVDFVQEV